MSERKNIAIIVPTLNKGGAERVAANLSLEFVKYYNVYVIVHDGTDITYPYAGELIDLKLPPAKGKLGKLTTLVKRIVKVRSIKKKYCIDYSISHLPPSNYVNIFSRVRDKVFCYIHSMETPSTSIRIREKLVAALSDKLICVSECVRENMINNFAVPAGKGETVYNFCDLDVKAVKQEASAQCLIANMGRLSEPKGQWHLIRAMKKVVNVCPEAHLVIYGEGSYRPMLEELIQKLEMGGHITLAGFVESPFEMLAQADIYVSSSLWEGLPMALIEAGYCGLPIISTDCDAGCREILSPSTHIQAKTHTVEEAEHGILVPVFGEGDYLQEELTKQEEVMADAIIMLVRDKEKRAKYAALAKKRAADFSAANIMQKWIELLE